MAKNVFRLYSFRDNRGYYCMTEVIDDDGNLVSERRRNAPYGRLELNEPSCRCNKPVHDCSKPSVFAGRKQALNGAMNMLK